jgi:hypothetical protein
VSCYVYRLRLRLFLKEEECITARRNIRASEHNVLLAEQKAKQAERRAQIAETESSEAKEDLQWALDRADEAERRAADAETAMREAGANTQAGGTGDDGKLSRIRHAFAKLCHPDLTTDNREKLWREELYKRFNIALDHIEKNDL